LTSTSTSGCSMVRQYHHCLLYFREKLDPVAGLYEQLNDGGILHSDNHEWVRTAANNHSKVNSMAAHSVSITIGCYTL
jgi:hypothetical protein